MITYDMVQAKDKYKKSRKREKRKRMAATERDTERKKRQSKRASRSEKEKERKRERSQTRQALIICWLMIKRRAVAKRHAVVDLSSIHLNQIRVCGLWP